MKRYIQITREMVTEKDGKRSIKVAFSSEYPVRRIGDGNDHTEGEPYDEVLSHDDADCDLSLLQNRGAFLDEHDPKSPLGVILTAGIDAKDRVGRADIECDDAGLGCERGRQMANGIRPHISVGYDQTRLISTKSGKDGIPTKTFAWRGHEISSVSTPADPLVGVGRKHPSIDNPQKVRVTITQNNSMTPEEIKAKADHDAAVLQARKESASTERKRISGLRGIGAAYKKDFTHPDAVKAIDKLVADAEESDEAPSDFSVRVLTVEVPKFTRGNVKIIAEDELHDDIDQYSFARAVQYVTENNKNGDQIPKGLEGEVHAELVKRSLGFNPQGFLMPYRGRNKKTGKNLGVRLSDDFKIRSHMSRAAGDLQAGVFGQGGAAVATELQWPLIKILRNLMVCSRLGVRTISGLEGNISWPRHVATSLPFFVPETFLLQVTNPLLDQLNATPHRIGVTGAVSKQLILQVGNSLDVENWLRDDQLQAHAEVVDQITLLGNGANNTPLGIANTPGIGLLLFNGGVTYQTVVHFKTLLALANAAVSDMAFVTTPLVEEKWRVTPKTGVANQFPIFIWEDGSWGDDTADGRVIGLRATATNQIQNDRVLFGNFGDCKQLMWGGLDVVVNPWTRSKEAVVEITTNSWMDVMVDHQQSFVFSGDAGDQ